MCFACLEPDKVAEWILKNAKTRGSCLLADIPGHSDGKYRVTVAKSGTTKTSKMLNLLFAERWEIEMADGERMRPSCGNWACLVQDHWVIERTPTTANKLAEARMVIAQLVYLLHNIDVEIEEPLLSAVERFMNGVES